MDGDFLHQLLAARERDQGASFPPFLGLHADLPLCKLHLISNRQPPPGSRLCGHQASRNLKDVSLSQIKQYSLSVKYSIPKTAKLEENEPPLGPLSMLDRAPATPVILDGVVREGSTQPRFKADCLTYKYECLLRSARLKSPVVTLSAHTAYDEAFKHGGT
ncbi:hypothetical protein Q8A67_025490 [Cirrhinus molitorella]|uniref:Uncharacterized protein n=1 Tax=Cirrhinus molitorella TaxID=172907 RepID=A0AA88T9Q9_9TELE|nr:hypothetical protein Q8A67_025490 [Cirrhinus molitorella]